MKKLLKKLSELEKEGFFENLTEAKQKKINALINKELKKHKNRYLTHINADLTRKLSKAYIWYKRIGVSRNNKGLKGWRLEKVKPKIRQALRARINFSMDLIRTQNNQTMEKLRARFLDWTMSPKERVKTSEVLQKNDKHMKMILSDQTRKMISNFDHIVAEEYGAIAFIWKTRRDKKVVGNPSGLYPKGNEKHENHFERQDKIYFYHKTWAIEKKLINTKHKDFKWADFEDGMPGQPINCRCYAYNLYDLHDIPKELLSKAGVKYLEKKD